MSRLGRKPISIPDKVEVSVKQLSVSSADANNVIKQSKSPAVHTSNSERRDILLSALKTKGPSSVGELVGVFESQVSEKTVQRELNAMVEAGVVKKDGEKRWRRYFV